MIWQKGWEPDLITYSAAISACEKVKQPKKAMELPRGMQWKRPGPDVITYTAAYSAAISTCLAHGVLVE